MAEEKQPFVASSDRPNVGLHPDTPISELRVRDLQALMQGTGQAKSSTEKQFKAEMKVEKIEHPEKHFKNEMKLEKAEHPEKVVKNELKAEKFEHPEKLIKNELKLEKLEHPEKQLKEKVEKLEQPEKLIKNEMKLEKLEWETSPQGPVGPGPESIDQLIQAISSLAEQVTQLHGRVEQLRQQTGGAAGTGTGAGETGGTSGTGTGGC